MRGRVGDEGGRIWCQSLSEPGGTRTRRLLITCSFLPPGLRVQLRNVFLLSAAVNIAGLFFYLIFGQAEVQDWAKGRGAPASEQTE